MKDYIVKFYLTVAKFFILEGPINRRRPLGTGPPAMTRLNICFIASNILHIFFFFSVFFF